ncbi:MAG TPA: T9SS type A sorting domain-containing protein [Bacteroidia bacterium]|nr:T9SS type A sorting domain-containing protein [Bacteroidia bacterium]
MIRKILTLSFLCFAWTANAQQLSNSGFETWTGNVPPPWGTLDQAMAAAGLSGSSYVTKSSSPHTGSFAAQIQTQAAPLIGTVVQGALIYGTITINVSTQKATFKGLPFTYMPDGTTYYIKGNLVAGDTTGVFVMLSKWNSVSGKRDTLGKGIDTVVSLTSTYVLRTVPIKYTLAGIPDSIQYIIASSGKKSPPVGTVITVDDVNLDFATGISEPLFTQPEFMLYPNPAQNQITLSSGNDKARIFSIYDLSGRILMSHTITGRTSVIDLKDFQNGLYIYKITGENAEVLKCSKFIVAN